MKRFLPYIFILILAVGIFGPIVVDAQGAGMVGGYGTQNYLSQPQAQQSGGIWGALYKLLIPADWLAGAVGWVAYEIILVLTAWILGLSGLILDQVIMTTIVTMSDKINSMVGINTAWQITRDIMNIAFIFLLVYEAIMIIISQRSVDSMKKLIGGIILAAILINFSLFFTKILIDASNIITIGLYNSAIDVNGPLSGSVGPTGTQTSLAGLSVPFMKALGFTELWSNASFNQVVNNAGGSGTSALIFSIAGAVLFLITAFVFFAISIMLIIRFVVLVILLMTSPVAYMGLALPFMKPFATQWWNSLKGQLLFAPIFMFMTLIILTLMGSANFLTVSGASWGDVVNPKGGAGVGVVDLIIKFAVIIGLTIGALVTSKKYAVQGSDLIGTATGKLSAFAGGAVMGGAARVGRNTLGRAGNAIANSERLKDAETSNSFILRNAARYTRAGGTKAATSTFDARGSSAFKSLESSTGMKFGKAPDAKKINFQKIREEKAKNEAEYAKTLKPQDDLYENAKLMDADNKQKLEAEMNTKNAENETAQSNLKTAQDKIKNIEDEIKKKEQELKDAALVETQTKIKEEIERLKNDSKRESEGLRSIQELANQADKAHKEAKNAHDNYKSEESKLKDVYEGRVKAYAQMVEDESRMVRYAKNILRIPASVVSGVTPGTAGDNRMIASKIRGVLREKTKKELAAEAAAAAFKEDQEKEEKSKKTDEGGEDKQPKEGGGENKTS